MKRKLPLLNANQDEQQPSKVLIVESNCGDPFQHFLWDEDKLNESTNPNGGAMLSKKRANVSVVYQPYYTLQGKCPVQAAKTIKYYFDQYRVHLREAQNGLPGWDLLKWGTPVQVGRSKMNSLDVMTRDADTVPLLFTDDLPNDNPGDWPPTRLPLQPTGMRQMRYNTRNILSRGQQMMVTSVSRIGKVITSGVMKLTGNVKPEEKKADIDIFPQNKFYTSKQATDNSAATASDPILAPETQAFDSEDDFVSLPKKVSNIQMGEIIPETQIEEFGNEICNEIILDSADEQEVEPNKKTPEKKNQKDTEVKREGRNREPVRVRQSRGIISFEEPTDFSIDSFMQDNAKSKQIKGQVKKPLNGKLDAPVIAGGELMPSLRTNSKGIGAMVLDSPTSGTDERCPLVSSVNNPSISDEPKHRTPKLKQQYDRIRTLPSDSDDCELISKPKVARGRPKPEKVTTDFQFCIDHKIVMYYNVILSHAARYLACQSM